MTDTTVLVCFMFVLCDLSKTFSASVLSSENDFSTRDRFETVVTYFKDHEVSERQARENLIGMTEKDFNRPAYCTNCTREHQRYCHSENLLKDHCCCNQSHKTGEFTDPHIDFFISFPRASEEGFIWSRHSFVVCLCITIITRNNEAWKDFMQSKLCLLLKSNLCRRSFDL